MKMDEKEKVKLLKEAEEYSKRNMIYKKPKRGKSLALMIVVVIYLILMFLSLSMVTYFKKLLF